MCGLKQSSEPLSQNNKRLCSNKLKNGFENTQVFADDGYSGVNFERPAFRRMLHLIEDGNELAPFKNLFNEWFARDTSKKIRAVKRAKTVADILSREDYIGNTVNCHRAVIQGQA